MEAIRNHKFVNMFQNVGNADLSCFVNFSAFKKAVAAMGKRSMEMRG